MQSIRELGEAAQALADCLELPTEKVAVLASKETRLLTMPVQQLSQSLAVLRSTCLGGFSLQEAAQVRHVHLHHAVFALNTCGYKIASMG